MTASVSPTDIEHFLAQFAGDSDQAIQAIHDYARTRRVAQHVKTSAGDPTASIVIDLQDVHKSYKMGRQHINALGGISLQIRQGEFVALTGSSGSGKSTLLQLIGGLDKPSSGVVEVGGVNLSKLSDRALSRFRGQTVGFVFQFFYLQPFLRVDKNLEVPAMFTRTKSHDRRATLEKLATAVGIADRLSHLPRELSGGQMQRVAIARALMNQPKVLLADEPTGNLDSTNGRAIIDLFETIRQQFGTTVVIVTHDAQIAARADREIRLQDGVLV
jgi:ABC-type lipoprotein export system ATPase subunit